MSDLKTKHCVACEGGAVALSSGEAKELLDQLGPWKLGSDEKRISRRFEFKNYYETMAFVNAVAWMAHREDHHPDLKVSWGSCDVEYSTHAIGGLSENDFICAAKVDALLGD